EGIGLHCLTFDRSFTVAPNEVDRSAPATAVPSLRQAALDGPCTVAISRFQIMSNDVAFKDLAQGLLADIAAQISRFREVRFIASNPAISAASDPASIISSADEAGAHYVIGGTLRSSANKVRLTTNVIDTRSETQIWANGYELPISRMYMGQDEFTRSITTSVVTALRDDQLAIANRKEIDALSAWECYLRGSSIMHTFDPEAQAEAIAIFKRGIRLDPGLADLHAALSYSKITQSRILRNLREAMALGHQQTSSRVIAFDLAKKALQMDPRVPLAWLSLGRSHLCLGEFESAILALERALELNPNFGWVHYMLGFCYWPLNRASEALAALDMARDTLMEERCQWTVIAGRACALMAAGRFEEAIQAATRAQIDPRADQFAFCPEICSLSHLGRRAEAKQALQKAQKKLPNFGLASIENDQPLPDPEIRKMIADGLKFAERGPNN
ncbi:MAG: tetratricopeptide repeat protein, partial [Pseudomonadota bacterium]